MSWGPLIDAHWLWLPLFWEPKDTTQLGLSDYKIVLKTTSKSNTKRSQRARKFMRNCAASVSRAEQLYECVCECVYVCVSVGLFSFIKICAHKLASPSPSPSPSQRCFSIAIASSAHVTHTTRCRCRRVALQHRSIAASQRLLISWLVLSALLSFAFFWLWPIWKGIHYQHLYIYIYMERDRYIGIEM